MLIQADYLACSSDEDSIASLESKNSTQVKSFQMQQNTGGWSEWFWGTEAEGMIELVLFFLSTLLIE
jgi:hypothetical protein